MNASREARNEDRSPKRELSPWSARRALTEKLNQASTGDSRETPESCPPWSAPKDRGLREDADAHPPRALRRDRSRPPPRNKLERRDHSKDSRRARSMERQPKKDSALPRLAASDRDPSPEPYRTPVVPTTERRRDRSRDSDRSRHKRSDRLRERRRSTSRESRRDRSKDRRGRPREKDKDRDRKRDRSRDGDRERKRDRSKKQDREKRRDRSRDRDREKRRDRSRDRDREKQRDGPSDRRARSKDRESLRRRDRSRDRRRSRSPLPYRSRKQPTSSSSRSPPPKRRRHPRSPSSSRSHSQEISFRGLDSSTLPPTKYGGAPPTLEKPNFKPTGLLAKAANKVAGTKISLKYHEPPEARKPPASAAWRLFVFDGDDVVDTIELHTRSCWLFGRAHEVVDYVLDEPSASAQHAVVQFRYVTRTVEDEFGVKQVKGRVRPYVIDLESSNGTELNGERIETSRYFELRDKDILRFAGSEREFVVVLPPSEK